MGDPSGTRLVCLTESEALFLDRASLFERWKGAPADPAEAVAEVLTRLYGSVTLTWGNERDVLAALGCVVERPANTGDHHA